MGTLTLRPVAGRQIVRQLTYGGWENPLDGHACSLVRPWGDAPATSLFLAHTPDHFPNQHCLLPLDRTGWHTTAAVEIPPTIHLLGPLAYSTELNLVEHLWDHWR